MSGATPEDELSNGADAPRTIVFAMNDGGNPGPGCRGSEVGGIIGGTGRAIMAGIAGMGIAGMGIAGMGIGGMGPPGIAYGGTGIGYP
jgi:hypothetical protein